MADSKLEKIRSEALRLPKSDRADLAHSLVLSLDGPADSNAETAWGTEVGRRVDEIEAGTAELIDREELRRRMTVRSQPPLLDCRIPWTRKP